MLESDFINLYEDPVAKLKQVRTILDAFDTLQVELLQKGSIKDYSLDDGQVRISRSYNSLRELQQSRLAYEQLANKLIEQIEGRTTRFIPDDVRYFQRR